MDRIPRTATLAITALTALAWLFTSLAGADDAASLSMGFIPVRLSGAEVPWAAVPAFLTPLSATLVHGGFWHLAFNMLMLVWCGTATERVLGRGALVLLYLVGAFTAAIAQWASDPMGAIPMIGASGAVSAVVGAFALSFGRAKRITKSAKLNRWINAAWLLAAWVILQLMVGWIAGGQGHLLAVPAHIGGFVAGLLLQRPLLLWRYRGA